MYFSEYWKRESLRFSEMILNFSLISPIVNPLFPDTESERMKKIIIQNLKVTFSFFVILLITGLIIFYKYFGLETTISIAIVAAIASLVLIISMGIYQLVYIKPNKISLDGFSILATQEATFTVDESEEEALKTIENNIPEKINAYPFKYNHKLDFYKTKTGATLRSWGENIIVKLTKIDDLHTQLYVQSRHIFKITLIDFGKSSMNIEKFKLAFSSQK